MAWLKYRDIASTLHIKSKSQVLESDFWPRRQVQSPNVLIPESGSPKTNKECIPAFA